MNESAITFDREALARIAERYGLDLIVFFGSRMKGRARAGSDLDIAIRRSTPGHGLLSGEINSEMQLIGDLVSAIHAPDGDVDIVLLNDAPPLLMFEVASHGRAVYESEPALFARFKSYAARLYDTNRKFIAAQETYLRRRIAHVA
jgi:predicted nucleotidyltransferase